VGGVTEWRSDSGTAVSRLWDAESRPRPFGQPDVPRRAKAGAFAYVLWCPFRAHRLQLPNPGSKRSSGPLSGKRFARLPLCWRAWAPDAP